MSKVIIFIYLFICQRLSKVIILEKQSKYIESTEFGGFVSFAYWLVYELFCLPESASNSLLNSSDYYYLESKIELHSISNMYLLH